MSIRVRLWLLLLAIFVGPDAWHYVRHLWNARPGA